MHSTRSLALAAAVALALGPISAAAQPGVPGVIDDDWPLALATARERRVPILVDVWAPW